MFLIPSVRSYACVSTATQGRDGNLLEEQVTALESYGCQEIVMEAFTGKTMDRLAFQSLLRRFQPNDTLVVCKLDRLYIQHGSLKYELL